MVDTSALDSFECGYNAGEERGYQDAQMHFKRDIERMKNHLILYLAKEDVAEHVIDGVLDLIDGYFK